jgi:uncharacterized membrane protein YidH (DUF202 family)
MRVAGVFELIAAIGWCGLGMWFTFARLETLRRRARYPNMPGWVYRALGILVFVLALAAALDSVREL